MFCLNLFILLYMIGLRKCIAVLFYYLLRLKIKKVRKYFVLSDICYIFANVISA